MVVGKTRGAQTHREVLHDGGGVDSGRGADTLLGVHAGLEETVDTTDGELEPGTAGPGLGRALRGRGLAALATLATLAALAALATLATSEIHFLLRKCVEEEGGDGSSLAFRKSVSPYLRGSTFYHTIPIEKLKVVLL